MNSKLLMQRGLPIILGVLLAIALLIVFSIPTRADTPAPDTTPIVEDIDIYRNLLETGDVLVIIYANIPYSTTPDTPINETFVWRLFDGVTELGSTLGYAYNDDGYGWNVYAMYFAAADAYVWNSNYTLRLSGNPTLFDTPPEYNYTIGASDYTSYTTQADNQAELATRVIALATNLDIRWGLSTSASLLLELETATVLSIYGEAFFRGAIYGLQGMAPAAFRFIDTTIDTDARGWSDNYSANLTNQYTGTWVGTAKAAGATLFGTSWDLLSMIILLCTVFGCIIGNIITNGNSWHGVMDGLVILILGAKLGMYGFGYLGLFEAICILYIGAKFWGIMR